MIKRYFLFIFLFIPFNGNICAQTNTYDYLILIDKADSLLFAGEINQSIELFKKVIGDSEKVKNDSILSEALSGLSSIYNVMGMHESMLPLTQQALTLKNPGTTAMIDIHTHVGGNRRSVSDHDSALYHFKKAVALNRNVTKSDSNMMAASLMEVVGSFTSLNMGDSALVYCLEAINYVESNSRKNALAYAYTRISDVFKSLHNVDRAQEYAQKALDVSADTDFKAPKLESNIAMAQIMYLKEDYDSALEYIENAFNINNGRKNNMRPKIEITYLQCILAKNGVLSASDFIMLDSLKINNQEENEKILISLIELKASNSSMNLKTFESKVDQLWREIDADNKSNYAKELLTLKYDYLKSRGAWEKALICKEELSEINRKHLAAQQQYTIFELEARYNKNELDNEIKLLDKQNEIQNVKLNGKNKLILAGTIGLGLISLLALFLFRSRRTVSIQKEKIAKSLDEKDTLLREIHHRVKNNLQVISSLLRLQSNTTDDEAAVEALKEGQNRVQSMSLIHQNLYQKENLTGINMSEYLERLCNNLFATYNISKEKINLETDIQNLNLDVDSVVPLGLIINELITNSLKYAFPEDRKGTIKVSLHEINKKLKLVVSDNGIGMSEKKNIETSKSFGHRLINSFARKLDADVTIKGDSGTHVEILISDYSKTRGI